MRRIRSSILRFWSLIYGLAGLLLGLDMGIRHDHAELPTHAHIMVVGWVTFHDLRLLL